ncbi:MAG TPA: heterodisulfide reductase-related iron-sulfur binding cluster [Bacillota bacterium]|nr:heterodisulfide reductase-related iron-sulfur binding cluster [Bacillota bacterium]
MQPPEPLPMPPLAWQAMDTCVHCGFCLPACPTYRELGSEADSPRGRIFLIRSVAEGRLDASDPAVQGHLDLCLDCRACETACPSGVAYGTIIEGARAALRLREPASPGLRFIYRGLLAKPRRMAVAARLTALAQRAGLTRGRAARLLPGPLAALAGALPPVSRQPARRLLPAHVGSGEAAAAFLGCVQDAFFAQDDVDMVRVLAVTGHGVAVPQGQACCGALHVHAGDEEGARELARQNVAAFAGTEGPIAVNAAGCGATLKEYGRLLPDEPAAAAFAARVRDFSELAAALPPPARPVSVHATYHEPCHLAHAQRVRAEPRQALRQVPGLDLIELPESDACCGSAGVYNFTQFEMSMAVLDRKMANVRATGADTVVTCNPGCALQLRLGAQRAGLAVDVRSLCSVLAEAYGVGDQAGGAAQ